MRCVLVVLLLAGLAWGSHFRGGTISFKPNEDTTGQFDFYFRMAWRWTSTNNGCTQQRIDDGILHGSSSSWNSDIDGAIGNTQYLCTDFSTEENWATGGNSFSYVFSDTQPRVVSYDSCCWISVKIGGGDWNLQTLVNPTPRNDTGRPNSSPISASAPVVRIPMQCDTAIRIPVEDPDGDKVKCRWAVGYDECGDICGGPTNMTVDEEACVLNYDTSAGMLEEGWWAVALVMEDFSRDPSCVGSSAPECGPFTQTPLQFLAFVFNSSVPCNQRPQLVGRTPEDQGCVGIPTGGTYTAIIEAESDVTEISTTSPIGLTKSSLTAHPDIAHRSYVTVTWTPTAQQAGQHVFCFRAMDANGILYQASKRLVEIGKADSYHTRGVGPPPAADPPVAMLNSRSPDPSQPIGVDDQITWSLTFDMPIEAPSVSRFIRFNDWTDTVVLTIDTSSSPDVQISGSTLEFSTGPGVFAEGRHYILMDAGAVVTPSNCETGVSFDGISDSTVWAFSAECPAGFSLTHGFGRCLHRAGRPLTYDDASQYCGDMGGNLFQIDSEAKANRMKTILDHAKSTTDSYVGMWVGLDDKATEGTFSWADGTALATGDYTDWAPAPYDGNSNKRDCVQMKQKFDWQWVIRSCMRVKNYFFCEPN
ncbi:hypothetical protein Bbelb_178830 [Branchiostoma belcheri]|nr:hypothetical protein Bbelb_178830 [Branchiostoma belcheri]